MLCPIRSETTFAPAEGEELAEPQPAQQRHSERQLARHATERPQQEPGVLRGQHLDLDPGHSRPIDGVDRIHGQRLPPDGVRHRPMQHAVDLLHRRRSEPRTGLPVPRCPEALLQGDDVRRPEPLERKPADERHQVVLDDLPVASLCPQGQRWLDVDTSDRGHSGPISYSKPAVPARRVELRSPP